MADRKPDYLEPVQQRLRALSRWDNEGGAIPQIASRIMFNQPLADSVAKNLLNKLLDSVRRLVNPFLLDGFKTVCQFNCFDSPNGPEADARKGVQLKPAQ